MLNVNSKLGIAVLVWLIVLSNVSSASVNAQSYFKEKTDLQFMAGLNRGFGLGTNLLFHDLSSEFHLDIRLGLGYTWLNPGNSSDARRVFINNATNGTPEKKGHNLDFRFDFIKPITFMGNENSYAFFGPRYSFFKGNFKYVGGNEDFDITSAQFGLGGGFESHYSITKQLKLVFTGGLDYFLPGKLQGHDTAYYPDDDNVNARTNNDTDVLFDYNDADDAIDQPKWMPRLMVGIQWDF